MLKQCIPVLLAILGLAACTASSDEQQIRELLAAAESAAEARDTSAVMDLIDPDYADAQGMDKAQLQQYLRGYFLLHPKIELMTRIDQVELETATRARVQLGLVMVGQKGAAGDTSLTGDTETLQLELRRRDGEWRVARADRVRL